MKDNKIDIQNTKKIILPKNNMEKNKISPSDIWKTSIRLPGEDKTIMLQIEMKMQELGFKKASNQERWHVALNLLHKLLEYVDESQINKNADMQTYLEMLIDKKMGD